MKITEMLQKGYLLEIISWENDGDNYRTKYVKAGSLEQAKELKDLLEGLFGSETTYLTGVGNSCEDEEYEAASKIRDYLENNQCNSICKDLNDFLSDQDEHYLDNPWNIIKTINGFAHKAMGGSEYYLFRVVESVNIYHIPETFSVTEVK